MIKVAILLALAACAFASELKQADGPDEYKTRHILGEKQHYVNIQALHRGAGVGTAPIYGVPGTSVRGHGYYGHGYYGHGYPYGGNYGGHYGGYGHRPYNNGHYYGGYPYGFYH